MKTKNLDFFLMETHVPVFITDNNLMNIFPVSDTNKNKFIIIIDANVYMLHRVFIDDFVHYCRNCPIYCFDASEENKSTEQLVKMLNFCIENNAERDTTIVAIGGGLTGNVAGVVAGLLYRGIKLMHIPTTLLAMSDSALSAKQAVNGEVSKNIYGLYLKPSSIIIDRRFLKTLPNNQYTAGLVELFKNSLAFERESICECLKISIKIKSLIEQQKNFSELEENEFYKIVEMGLRGKQRFLVDDLKEKGDGLVLEYGHTFGHALELESKNEIPHGIAVGIGMLVAARIAFNRGYITVDDYNVHLNLLKNIGSLVSIPKKFKFDNIISRMNKDNKRGYIKLNDDEHPFILLKSLGVAKYSGSLPLVAVNIDEILEAYNYLRE